MQALGKALDRLDEVLARDPAADDIVLDAAIQRFEFCYELLWKAIKRCAERYGHAPASPRDAFRTAYAMRWIDDEALWLGMIRDRNLTSHAYQRATALAVLSRLPGYLVAMRRVEAAIAQAAAAP